MNFAPNIEYLYLSENSLFDIGFIEFMNKPFYTCIIFI